VDLAWKVRLRRSFDNLRKIGMSKFSAAQVAVIHLPDYLELDPFDLSDLLIELLELDLVETDSVPF